MNERAPTVSVIIPFLDPAVEYLREAVESVVAQTYADWELLLVDDGSVGPASAVARQYAAADPSRIAYVDFPGHANRGLAAARNLGVRQARGDYVATLDADDVWLPHKLERQVRIFEEWPEAAMVYGTTRYWHGWTGRASDVKRDFVQEHSLLRRQRDQGIGNRLIRPPTLLTLYLRDEAAVPSASNIMARRSTVLDLGGFETQFQLYEDQTFYAKVCTSASVFVSDECWDLYRQHPDSMCATAGAVDHQRARLAYFEWLDDYLETSGTGNGALRRELGRKLWLARRGQPGRAVEDLIRRWRHLAARPLRAE